VETLTYSSGRASGCNSPGLLNDGATDEGRLSRRREPTLTSIRYSKAAR